jgi:CRP/FNR family transcriptional regulator, cyclic AMP receptor protein
MPSDDTAVGYTIWGSDYAAYGPVELPALIDWIKDERVTSDTWIFVECNHRWEKAAHLPELQMFFKRQAALSSDTCPSENLVSPDILRRVKILSTLSDEQLARFVKIMDLKQVPQWTQIVKQGDHGDAMYLVLEGELRVRLLVEGRETTLATLGAGEFFGELSLFDQGPRAADVVSNYESTVLKISAADFEKLTYDAPDLIAPILFAIGKTLTARIRADNKRYHDSIAYYSAAH